MFGRYDRDAKAVADEIYKIACAHVPVIRGFSMAFLDHRVISLGDVFIINLGTFPIRKRLCIIFPIEDSYVNINLDDPMRRTGYVATYCENSFSMNDPEFFGNIEEFFKDNADSFNV